MSSIKTKFIALIGALFFASVGMADERDRFYGVWGTEQQCARAPIKPGGTVPAKPFEITPQWLKQGTLWCNLNWGPVETSENGAFTGANAQCGEDALRGYFLAMKLANKELTIRWDFPHANGPLMKCEGS